MATLVDVKGPIKGPSSSKSKPQTTAVEDLAEEMISGIFCHYEPPDNHKHKGILRKPRKGLRKSHRRNESASQQSGSGHRRVRWSDDTDKQEEEGGSADHPRGCVGPSFVDAAVAAGLVSPMSGGRYGEFDYDLRETFSEDSQGNPIKPRKSRAHHHVMYDDQGNPMATKAGVRAPQAPPLPPPRKKESFIPELCGVRIGFDDEDDEDDLTEDSSRRKPKSKKSSSSSHKDKWERPDHTRYRPSYEYHDDDGNSLTMGEQSSLENSKTNKSAAPKKAGPLATTENEAYAPSALPAPPPPPPPPPAPQNATATTKQPGVSSVERDPLGDFRSSLDQTENDWESNDGAPHPAPKSNEAEEADGEDEKDDWDESVPLVPADEPKEDEEPQLDAPDSRDSQEENKEPATSSNDATTLDVSEGGMEAGTDSELAYDSPSPVRRKSFFMRGRNKRQSTLAGVNVLGTLDETSSQISKPSEVTEDKSFLNFRSRSKSPSRRRIFGRNKTSDLNADNELSESEVNGSDKQSFIMAYRDSINAVDIGKQKATEDSETISNLHPAHPLKQNGKPGASEDDLMERQSFITAYRSEMDSGPKVQTIPERLRRLRAQRRTSKGSNPVDLDDSVTDSFDDEQFERQSMITAHRSSFEPSERNLPKISRVQRPPQEDMDDFDEEDIPEHLKALIRKKIEEAKREILMKTNSLEQIQEVTEEEDLAEEDNTEPAVLDWEEKTRQAWERLRGGLGLSVEAKEEPGTDGNDVSKDGEDEDPKAEEPGQSDPADEVVQETSTFEALTNLFQSVSLSSTDSKQPLKGILKSPGSEKKVTFGQDEERLFHVNQDENLPSGTSDESKKPAPQKKTHPNQQPPQPLSFQPYPYMYPPFPMMAPASPMGTPMSPSGMQQHPYFPQMMPGAGVPNDATQQSGPTYYPQMMPGQSLSTDSLQHAAPQYYYGFPGHYGGYVYPQQQVMLPTGGLPDAKKKKKKRVFKGRKFLSGVIRGRHSIGGTFSASQSTSLDSASSVYDGSITTAEA